MAEFWASTYGFALSVLLQGLAIIAFVMGSLIFMVYGDRKIWAAVQLRRGPNVVGPWGLLQTFSDALKYVVKEIVVPAGADHDWLLQRLSPLLGLRTTAAAGRDELFAACRRFIEQQNARGKRQRPRDFKPLQ